MKKIFMIFAAVVFAAVCCGCVGNGGATDPLSRSKALVESRDFDGAIALQTALIADAETDAERAKGHFWRGYTYDVWKDELHSVRRVNPDAVRYAKLAAQDYLAATKLTPDFLEAHYNLALLRMDAGEWAAALTHFNRAHEIAPGSTEAQGYVAEIYFRRGDYEKSAAALRVFVTSAADSALREAKALDRAGDYEDAIRRLNDAFNLRPDFAQAHLEAGLIYLLRMREMTRAVYHLEKFCEYSDDESLKAGVQWIVTAIVKTSSNHAP